MLEIELFSLSDPIGIAGNSTDIDACILTRETEKGGVMINDKRKENGLGPMEMVVIEMVMGSEESKVSSTNIRKYIA
jgi:phosphopantetheine adenylyltransferase